MKLNFHSEPASRQRLIIPLSEFSYAAYAVQIEQGIRCVSHAPRTQTMPNQPQRRGWLQQISNYLRRACSEPTAIQ